MLRVSFGPKRKTGQKICKVEKTLKGSLDSITSPSVKIQIMDGKVFLRRKGKTLLGLENKKFVELPINVLPYYFK